MDKDKKAVLITAAIVAFIVVCVVVCIRYPIATFHLFLISISVVFIGLLFTGIRRGLDDE